MHSTVPCPTDQVERPRPATLIVEDDPRLAYIATVFLEDAGYDVVLASNAFEAMSQLERHVGIGLMLTDVSLGSGLDGIQLSQKVIALRPNIGVIITSGRTVLESVDLPHGCIFLPKPYRPAELLRMVASCHEDPVLSLCPHASA